MAIYFALLQGLVVLVIFGSAILRARRRGGLSRLGGHRATVEAAVALGGAGSVEHASPGIVLDVEGREFRLTGADFGKHGPQTFYLGTTVARPEGPRATTAFRDKPGAAPSIPRLPHLVLRRESERDVWGKRLGLNAEPQTGDAAFDDGVYVEHEGDRAAVRHMLAIPQLRAAALDALDDRTQLVLDAEGHAVAMRWRHGSAPVAPMEIRRAALALAAFADAIPPVRSLELRPPAARVQLRGVLGVSLGLVTCGALLGLSAVLRTPIDTSFWHLTVFASMGLVVAILMVGWLVARGRSRGLAMFGWTAAAAIGVVPPLTASALTVANSTGFTADRTEVVKVARAYGETHKGRRTCYVKLVPWREGITLLRDSRVSCTMVGESSGPKTALLQIGRGRLGYEWIESVGFGAK